MLRSFLLGSLLFTACVPAKPAPTYARSTAAAPARSRGIAVRGRIPRGQRVDAVVAIQVSRTGKRKRIRVRPAADGTYEMQLAPGYQYALAYEDRGRRTGNVTFPSASGRPSQVINVSQNVVVNQSYVELGETTYVGGVYVAAYDPGSFLDSDGDGEVDAQDVDDVEDAPMAFDESAFDAADVEEVEGVEDFGAADDETNETDE